MTTYRTAHPGPCNAAHRGGCSACHVFRYRPDVRAAMGGDPALAEPEPRPLPARVAACADLGDKDTPGCDCTDRHCRAGRGVVRHLDHCQACPGYRRKGTPAAATPALTPAPPVGRRHLVYHLLPVSGNGVWQECVNRLRLRWNLFDGRKIVAVMTGPSAAVENGTKTLPLDPPDVVRAYLPADCEVITLPNDPARWELVSWPHLWDRVLATAAPDDSVLYAHAKGVTRKTTLSLDKFGYTAQLWSRMLYDLALDYWPEVEAEFRKGHPVVGPAVKPGRFFDGPDPWMAASQWHYSGNIWWARAGDVKDRLAKQPVPVDRWGTEAWAGLAYGLHEAGQVGPTFPACDFYSADYWNAVAFPALAKWTAEHRPTPAVAAATPRVCLSVILPTSGRPTLARAVASVNDQLGPDEELIIKHDASRDWGHSPRREAMHQARGTHLMFADDDDVLTPGALARVREAVAREPGRVHVFRMRRGGPFNDVIWTKKEVRVGDISTQMFVVPNDPRRLGTWGTTYEGDHTFIADTLKLHGTEPVWHDAVIAVWRPD